MTTTTAAQPLDLDRLKVIAELLRKRGSFAISGELDEMIAQARTARLDTTSSAKECQYPNCGCTSRATCNFNYDRAPVAAQQAAADLSHWRHRALEAERNLEGALRALGAENGPSFMGEPLLPTRAVPSVSVLVDRFLGWPLPKDFSPDCGISFDGRKDDEWNKNKTWPTGTNLFAATQAKAMFEYCLQAAAKAPAAQAVDIAAIQDIADELELEASAYEGDFADTVNGCADALRHLIDATSPASTPEASQQAAAVAAPSEQQANVMPPTRGTESQQDIADAALCKHINALLALDADGALVPHGIGGHARELLKQASTRLAGAAKGGVTSDKDISAAAATTSEDARKLLQEFVDYHGKPAGMTLEVAMDTDRLGTFLEGVEAREKDMVARAEKLLAAMRATQQEGGK